MMDIRKISIFAGAALAAVIVVVLSFPDSKDSADREDEKTLKSVASRKNQAKSKVDRKFRSSKKDGRVKATPVRTERPKFDIPPGEEENLTALQRKLLEEIRAALRQDDYRKLMRLVHKMQASDEWPDGIPKAIKKAALDALGWYGSKCLPEIVNFLGDADAEVVADATSQWEDAIAECDSDREISKQVQLAARVVNESESMESILEEAQNMRHSVAVETFKDVLANGDALAKQMVLEQISDYTGDETITTAEQLDEWLEANPDDPGDEEMYGGIDESSNDDSAEEAEDAAAREVQN